MTDQQMQSAWQSIGSSTASNPASGNFNPRRKTALERLAARYRRFCTLELLMLPCSLLYFGVTPMIEDNPRRWIVLIAFSAYFLTCFFLDHHLYEKVEAINLYRMTVKDVADQALRLKKFHLKCVMYLLPAALALVSLLVWAVNFDFYVLTAIIAGAIFGACLGYLQFRRFMKEYRALSDDSDNAV